MSGLLYFDLNTNCKKITLSVYKIQITLKIIKIKETSTSELGSNPKAPPRRSLGFSNLNTFKINKYNTHTKETTYYIPYLLYSLIYYRRVVVSSHNTPIERSFRASYKNEQHCNAATKPIALLFFYTHTYLLFCEFSFSTTKRGLPFPHLARRGSALADN